MPWTNTITPQVGILGLIKDPSFLRAANNGNLRGKPPLFHITISSQANDDSGHRRTKAVPSNQFRWLDLSLFRFLDPIGLTQVFKGSANQVVTPRITAEEYNTKELSWQFFDCQPPKKELNKQQT
jgi:hypothetical protein